MATLDSWKADSGLDSRGALESKVLTLLYHQIEVSFGTVRHSLGHLENQRLIVRRHGQPVARRIPPRLHSWRPQSLAHHTALIAQTCSQPSLPEPR